MGPALLRNIEVDRELLQRCKSKTKETSLHNSSADHFRLRHRPDGRGEGPPCAGLKVPPEIEASSEKVSTACATTLRMWSYFATEDRVKSEKLVVFPHHKSRELVEPSNFK